MNILDQIDAAIDEWTDKNGTNPNVLLLGNAERKALLEEARELKLMASHFLDMVSGCRAYSILTDRPLMVACRMQVTRPSKEEKLAETLGASPESTKGDNMIYSDVMLDLEYLADGENAVIAQIGAVPFDIRTGYFAGMEDGVPTEAFDESPCLQDQLQRGREMDAATMAWWMNQCVLQGRTPKWLDDSTGTLDQILLDFEEWGRDKFEWKEVRVWSHVGNDIGKLCHAHRECEFSPPWHRSTVEHIQTLRRLAKIRGTEEQYAKMMCFHLTKTHDAVDDCVAQIKEVSLAWGIVTCNH